MWIFCLSVHILIFFSSVSAEAFCIFLFFFPFSFVVFEGTTKRKELHGLTSIRALSGTWGEKLDGTIFQAYKFDFSCTIFDEIYSGFVLLIDSRLDDDVGNMKLDLYLVSRMVKSSVSSCGQVHLDAEQVQIKLV